MPEWSEPSTATHTAVARQLRLDVTAKLLDPLAVLLDAAATTALRRRVEAEADVWAAQVTGRNERLARETATRIVSAVYQDGPEFAPPASWWRTPFGDLVARRFGHPTADVVPVAVAGAMLGITRQGVHDLVRRGKLDRDPGGGVLARSVRDRLNPV
ncbi:hypothetical protein [Actinosynnema sp. NPDC020468]|uniref:acyl-CoA-like ligand-binding transcription factor n=1 Tax=Actinosynnema sp. NPDC020468 TaxID=3154488 RepID=UPI0033F9CF2D